MKSYTITLQQHDEIKKRDFFVETFTVGKNKYQCYSVLMLYLLSDSPEMVNRETRQVEIVDKRPILDVYATAFDVGVETFNSDYGVDTSVLYSTNADAYIKTLTDKFNEPHTGWKWVSEEFSLIVTPSYIEKIGRASGTRFAFEKLKNNNKFIFEKFEGKGITPPPTPFTANKIIDIYDPKKVHKEFRKELKCDYETFQAWFVDGVICDKKMSWNYENGNKAQLRSFIYNLCGGWKPKETNTAFKIIVDSNNRDTQINNDLLQRLEKCRKD